MDKAEIIARIGEHADALAQAIADLDAYVESTGDDDYDEAAGIIHALVTLDAVEDLRGLGDPEIKRAMQALNSD